MRYFYFLLIPLLFVSGLKSQLATPVFKKADARLRAVFVYNFSRYFRPNDNNLLGVYRFGLLGADTAFASEIKKIAAKKTVNGLPMSVIKFNSVNEFNNSQKCEILYVDAAACPDFKLDPKLRNTLVVTYNNKDLFNSMISFVEVDNKLKFAFNSLLTERAGVWYNTEFESLCTAIVRTERPAEANEEVVKKWSSIVDLINEKLSVTGNQVTLSKNELKDVASKLDEQEKNIQKQLNELQVLNQDNKLQKEELLYRKKELQEQEMKMTEQRKTLQSQEKSIRIQGDKLFRQLEQINTQKTILWLSMFLLLFIVLGLGMLYYNYRKTQKTNALLEQQKNEIAGQHEIISKQKHLVEEKQKEITDSINYALRIQRALLASEKSLSANLGEHFILFIPKDIVSGDFYWSAETAGGRFILATADSTGHGVPGAIMSMLNISALETAIDAGLNQPAEILNFARKKIIHTLANDGSESGGKDGMDCSLISFDLKNNSLDYAAANNPVWIVRNGKLIQLEADKFPVGKHDKDLIPFTQHRITLCKNDLIYTLTDGLPDQFGGPKGKKFMYKKLKETLLANSALSMQLQRQALYSTLLSWQGDLEQVDDITLIGIRV